MFDEKDLNDDVEHCWVLLGRAGRLWYGKLKKLSTGAACRVDFSYEDIMKREEQRGDVIGFLHTHPNMRATPSSTDHQTMHAWVCSFGKPLICAIHGSDGLQIYHYLDDESLPKQLKYYKRLGSMMFGVG